MARRPLSLERQQDADRLKKVWDKFKAEAKEKGSKVTQEDVSEACGWNTQGAFSAYLNGRTPLNLDALIKLSTYFGVPPYEISPELAAE
ncbi:helix-turn-helix domain-containing protein [Acinetobacter baumannii]|uniref:helix-turn-helix domain-containing protein n=1 Tax=Acinetobacter baumannii TaxID=470 RepID=UPI001436C603|nr:helix-turn-helix transcriptional regulator [Acinetobacter baumannii]